MACEILVTTGICIVAGEITTNAYVDVPTHRARNDRDIGYNDAAIGFDSNTCGVLQPDPVASRPTSRWAWTPAAPATRA